MYKDGKNIIYSYKPDGMRYSKTIDDIRTTHVWDGQNIVLDISGNNRVKGRYLRGSSLSARIQDNQTHYYLHNAHGDVVYMIDSNFNMIKHYDYSAFGIENKSEKNDSNTFRYCGEYYDGEIKNIYLRARYYSPRTGRFTSEDPVMDGNNWYIYCSSNPIVFIDPSGLSIISSAKDYFTKFGNDALNAGKGIVEGYNERWNNLLDNPSLYTVLDYPLGTLSSNNARYQVMQEDMSLYNVSNWVTSGAVGVFDGAINPEEPYSFEHWANSLGAATLVVGTVEAVKSYNEPATQMLDGKSIRYTKSSKTFKSQTELEYHFKKHGDKMQKALDMDSYSMQII